MVTTRSTTPRTTRTGSPAHDPLGVLPRRAGGLPHEVALRTAPGSHGGAVRQVWIEADEAGVLADWDEWDRVELMAAGRPFVLERDLDGRGVRLVEPMGRDPVAAFTPARVGGQVLLADGTVLRWLEPTRAVFESGLVGYRGVNIIRFAMDGTALVLAALDLTEPPHPTRASLPRRPLQATRPAWSARPARVGAGSADVGSGDTRRGDLPDPRRGWRPDLVALLVLSWFVRLLEVRPTPPAEVRSGVRHLGV
ncbi:hypothetical protein [Frankia sp. R82]|uniref:hypothetical protein n=1 Tax=Frankia sp. R82 TaxID=2950553 RepID=UPI002043844C|nr:hypothetical protein [Frankia sp. R82]MCM3886428.1 hypothetical protein [Frankia sp. R82]